MLTALMPGPEPVTVQLDPGKTAMTSTSQTAIRLPYTGEIILPGGMAAEDPVLLVRTMPASDPDLLAGLSCRVDGTPVLAAVSPPEEVMALASRFFSQNPEASGLKPEEFRMWREMFEQLCWVLVRYRPDLFDRYAALQAVRGSLVPGQLCG